MVGWVAHVILVPAQVLLVLTLGLWTRTSDLGLAIVVGQSEPMIVELDLRQTGIKIKSVWFEVTLIMPATAYVIRASHASSLACSTWHPASGRLTWRWVLPSPSPSPTSTRLTPRSERRLGVLIQSNIDQAWCHIVSKMDIIAQKRGARVLCWHLPRVRLSSGHPSEISAKCNNSKGSRCSNSKVNWID